MDGQYPVYIPKIQTASITPNPANMNAGITISVSAIDELVYLDPTYFQSGEIYSGEV